MADESKVPVDAAAADGCQCGGGAASASSAARPAPMPVVDKAAWLEKRKALLVQEKELSRMKDKLAAQRRELGMFPVPDYVFDGQEGEVKLSELFGAHDQLVVQHFMFPTEWEKACASCSMWADGYVGMLPHLSRKMALALVAQAPQAKLAPFKKWKGWTVPMVSSARNTFNKDFGVEFTGDEASKQRRYNFTQEWPHDVTQGPGFSVFYKAPGGDVYCTYGAFARGMEPTSCVWGFLDMLPRGRDEKTGMDWVKHAQEY